MTRKIFVTGAGGYIGQKLVKRLAVIADVDVIGLVRRRPLENAANPSSSKYVTGDLLDRESYKRELQGADTVVHLAAATGKAAPDLYKRVNVEGTHTLIEACKTAGVSRFLHVSTIAVAYPNKRYYPYAETKAAAEDIVRHSGLDYLIVRPTIVIGPQAPIWQSLKTIAGLPIIVLPQGAAPATVQPIDVESVAFAIEHAMMQMKFTNETLDLGGPDILPMTEFLAAIGEAINGKSPRIIKAPLGPIRLALSIPEPLLRPLLPVTAGQLSVFANDSVGNANWLSEFAATKAAPIARTIQKLASDDKLGPTRIKTGIDKTNAPKTPALSERQSSLLSKEVDIFCRHLASEAPQDLVRRHYINAAQIHALADDETFSAFDRYSLKIARAHPLFSKIADAYCAFFCRSGALRRKLILLTALLEAAPPTSLRFDTAAGGGPAKAFLNLTGIGFAAGTSFLLGCVLLGPAHLIKSTAQQAS